MQNTALNNPIFDVSPLTSLASKNISFLADHQLITDRLYINPVKASDLKDYTALLTDSDVMKFIGIEAGNILSPEEIAELLQVAVEAWKTRGYGRWSLYDHQTVEFVGFCGFRSENGVPELIVALHKKYWGRGLAVEAAEACLKYGFECLGFTKVNVFTRPWHFRARRILKKLEADFEGFVDFHGVSGVSYTINAENFLNK